MVEGVHAPFSLTKTIHSPPTTKSTLCNDTCLVFKSKLMTISLDIYGMVQKAVASFGINCNT